MFVKQINELSKSLNIKYYNIDELEINDGINSMVVDSNSENPYKINESLSFNLDLINIYSFDAII